MARRTNTTPVILSPEIAAAAKVDRAAALAFFLLDQGQTIWGRWSGYLSASDQRSLLGRYVGRGRLVICGLQEEVLMLRSIAFGQDCETTFRSRWAALEA